MTSQEDLGFLTDQRKTLVLSLPTGVESVIVKYTAHDDYEHGIAVSCVMPAAKREIRIGKDNEMNIAARKRKFDIKCPELLFCSEYVDIPMFGQTQVGNHHIFILNTKVKDRIEAVTYYISNVHSGGAICFGSLAHPFSPKEAFNAFWESPFNDHLRGEEENELIWDLDDYGDPLDKYIKQYHKKGIKTQDWEDYTDFVCGKKFWASPKGADGVLVTSCNQLLKKIPSKYWRRFGDYPIIIALANQKDDCWEFTSNSFKFCLDKGFVTTQPKFSAKVAELKRKFNHPNNTAQPNISVQSNISVQPLITSGN